MSRERDSLEEHDMISQSDDYCESRSVGSAGAEPGELVETKCRYCHGRGTDPFGCPGPNSICQVCGGAGAIRVTAPFENCAACRGTGRWPGRRLTCSSCAGRGVKTVTGTMERCLACRGTGIQPGSAARLPCVRCSGSGFVAMEGSARGACRSEGARGGQGDGARAVCGNVGPAGRRTAQEGTPGRFRLRGRGSGQATASVSAEDRISAYVCTYPGANIADVQALFGMSKEEADRTLKQMVRGQRLREKRGAHYAA